jgi:glycosyltransferase involved in cell wall biosynthesis
MQSVRAQGSLVRECLVVDDASTPDSRPPSEATEGWPCRIVQLSRRHGLPGARQEGLREVRTAYVLFLDDDDRLTRGSLAELAGLLERSSQSVAAVGGRLIFDDESRTRPQRFVYRRRRLNVWRAAWFGWVAVSGQTLFRRSALDSCGGWDPRFDRAAEDQQLWLRISALGPVEFTPQLVLEYRAHEGQTRPADVALIEAQMRDERLVSLPSPARRQATRALDLRRKVERAEVEYHSGHGLAAARLTTLAMIDGPETSLDPLVRPRVLRILTHSLVASILGARGSAQLRGVVRRVRSKARRDPVPGSAARPGGAV